MGQNHSFEKLLGTIVLLFIAAGGLFYVSSLEPERISTPVSNEPIVEEKNQEKIQTFKEYYDRTTPEPLKQCFKDSLGEEFEKAYNDPNYILSEKGQEKRKACFSKIANESPETFKEFFDTKPKNIQECFKTALGDEFDNLYADSSYVPRQENIEKMLKCGSPE